MLLTRTRADDLVIYDIIISIPPDEQPERAADRIALLTTAYAKVIDGVRWHRVIKVDYDECIMHLELKARRFLGVPSGRVVIDVTRRDNETGGGQ